MAALALALTASLAWGLADFVGGIKSRALPLLTVLVVSQIAGLTIAATIVALRGEGPPEARFLLLAALAAVGGTGGLAAFYRGLSVGAMAVVAPVSATAAAIPVTFGILTGERPSALQLTGIALAIVGVALASREEVVDEHGREPAGTRRAAGIGLALVAALGFGSFFVAMSQASEGDALWAIVANRITGVSMLGGLVLALRPVLDVGAANLGALAGVGFLDMSANTLFAVASTKGLVSLVAVLSSLYPVVVVALAYVVLHERIRGSQLVGVTAALCGVLLIVAG